MGAIDFGNMFEAFSGLNEKEWKYDRGLSLGASEVFTCERKNFFDKFGYEPDDDHVDDWGAARRGDVIENNVAVPAVKAILPPDAELLYAGEEQETLKKGRLSATPDGLVVDAPRDALEQLGIADCLSSEFVVEFKSFDPRVKLGAAKPVHVGQTQVQMGLFHLLTNFRPEYAVIIYFNASILSDIRTFVVKRDEKVFEAAVYRSKRVFAAKDPKDMLPEGKINGDCKNCKFHEECGVAQGETAPRAKREVDPETHGRLAILAERQKDASAREKSAKDEKSEVEAEIKQLLRDKQTKGVGDDSFSISLAWCKGKTSTDLIAMSADGIDIEKYQKEGVGYDRLTVRLKD